MPQHKLAIVVTHPVQYFSPLFKEVAKELDIIVFYGYNPKKETGKDGFNLEFEWDVDLLNGYRYYFFENISRNKSAGTFFGIKVDYKDIHRQMQQHQITHCIIFGWHSYYYWQFYRYCITHRIKMAVRGDSQLNPTENTLKKIIKKLLYPLFIKRYDAIFYVGKRNFKYMQYYGAQPRKMIFSPHAVDQNFWKPQKQQANKYVTFLWVAKFSYIKQPMEAIKAFEKIHQKYPNTKLIMVGSGDLLQAVQDYISQHQIQNIELSGFKNQTELISYYSKADALLLTSYSETWGLVVNEAFSCLTPAIVSNSCGCVDDLIEDGKTGYQYKRGDVENLYLAMEKLIINRHKINFTNFIKKKNKLYAFKTNVKALKKFVLNN